MDSGEPRTQCRTCDDLVLLTDVAETTHCAEEPLIKPLRPLWGPILMTPFYLNHLLKAPTGMDRL